MQKRYQYCMSGMFAATDQNHYEINIPSPHTYETEEEAMADELSAEISKLMRKDADLSEKHLNDLIKLGVFISMTCQELLDEE